MNLNETIQLIDSIKAVSPQPFSDTAPAVWAEVLADIPLADARRVLVELSKGQTFIAPGELYRGAQVIRQARWQAFTLVVESNVPKDDRSGWDYRERVAIREAIKNGQMDEAGYRAYRDSGATITPADAPRAVEPHRCSPESGGPCWCRGMDVAALLGSK